MKTLAQRKSRFGLITIEEEKRTGAIAYFQGDYYQSHADRNGVSLLIYIHAIFGLLAQTHAQTVLMIGCAGGSLATMLARANCKIVAVDVNPHVFPLARRYFGLPDAVECHVADGWEFLFSGRRTFDAIVLDAFHGGRTPAEFFAGAFFAQARKRLKPDGAIFANVHVKDDRDDAADRMAARMTAVSRLVRILDAPGRKYRNAIVMAGNVKGLKKPSLVMAPEIESGKLANALDSMRFRPRNRAQRLQCA
jgi:spermidine synthase